MATTEQLLQALQTVIDPNTGKDFVSTKALKNLVVDGGNVAFDVELGYPAKSQIPGLRNALIAFREEELGISVMAWQGKGDRRVIRTGYFIETDLLACLRPAWYL